MAQRKDGKIWIDGLDTQFTGQSLSSLDLIESESHHPTVPVLPDLWVVKIGGQSIMDRGAVAVLLALMWRSRVSYPLKAAALAAGTLLITPYLFLYDLMVLAIAVAFLIRIGLRRGFRRYELPALGLVAALFMALAFIHVRDSHFGTTDVTMTCLLVWSVSRLIDGHLSKRRRDFVIGGILGGLAAATKYNAALLIVPLITSYLLNIFEQPPEERQQAVRDPRLFAYGLPFLAAFAIGVPSGALTWSPPLS